MAVAILGIQLRILIVLTLLAASGAGLFAWQYFRANQRLPVVRLMTVDVGAVSSSVAALEPSTVQSCQISELKSDLAATVSAVHAVAGDTVVNNKVLVELDSQTLRDERTRARDALDEARRVIATTCSTAHTGPRSIDVLRRGSVEEAAKASSQPFEAAGQEDPDCAKGKDIERMAVLQLHDLNTKLASLRAQAPFEGIIIDVAVQPNQVVVPGSALVRIADSRCLNVRVQVSGAMAKPLPIGAPACVHVSHTVSPDCSAHVISSAVNRDATHLEATVELSRLPSGVSLGSEVSVSFPLSSAADATRIPRSSLASDSQSVFQLDEQRGTVVRRPVEIGLRGSDYIEVISGIVPGQRVVTPVTGTLGNLKDGAAVHVVGADH
ncbi:MAG: efflux RND transporter periplasmic adaptor subunit [Gammaproteobacteria bacterium]